jgi:hypothetical protein
MARQFQNPEPSLFEKEEEQRIALTPANRAQLATLVGALLIEIAAALATGEAGDDQDNG